MKLRLHHLYRNWLVKLLLMVAMLVNLIVIMVVTVIAKNSMMVLNKII